MHLFYLNFIQLPKCFLPSCLSAKLSGAVDNFKVPLFYRTTKGASPACLSSHRFLHSSLKSKPFGSSARITQSRCMSHTYLIILSYSHGSCSVKGCAEGCGGTFVSNKMSLVLTAVLGTINHRRLETLLSASEIPSSFWLYVPHSLLFVKWGEIQVQCED